MASIPEELKYTAEHEWVREEKDGVYTVGITDYAQGELGDVVFVELPEAGAAFEHKEAFGTIEAVKAVSELYAPLSGEVVEVNGELDSDPALVNSDPYGEGWMVKIRGSDAAQLDALMDAGAYREHIGE
ncbi:MAG: glycine cleavage system protein GcvH [Longimicrobiaceae bacterium]